MGLLGSLIGFTRSTRSSDPALRPLLDEIASAFGKDNITAAPAYEERLVPALKIANDYFAQQVAAIPGPTIISLQACEDDPLVGTLFPSQDDFRFGLGRSLEVKESLPRLARAGHESVFALLGMRHRPNDQTEGSAPIFVDHTLKCLAATEEEVRDQIRQAAFMRLLGNFGEHVDKLRFKKQLLKVEWNILKEAPSGNARDRQEFVHADEELTPDNLVRGLCSWLSQPSEHLRVSPGEIRLVLKNPFAVEPACYDLPLLHSADRRQWISCLVKIPTPEAIDAVTSETRAHRYIFI